MPNSFFYNILFFFTCSFSLTLILHIFSFPKTFLLKFYISEFGQKVASNNLKGYEMGNFVCRRLTAAALSDLQSEMSPQQTKCWKYTGVKVLSRKKKKDILVECSGNSVWSAPQSSRSKKVKERKSHRKTSVQR